MKNLNFFLSIIFSLGFFQVKSFGIKNDNTNLLLIYFLKEKNQVNIEISSEEEFMKKLMYKELYSTFNVGLPNQNLKFYYEMNEVESSISQQFYYPKRSTTYSLIKEKNDFSKDLFILDNEKTLDNFDFFLKQKLAPNKAKNYNSIGLSYRQNDNDLSFLSKLNKKGYIKNRVFTFLFGDDSFSETRTYDGQILFGIYPHEVNPYFDETELNFISLKEKEKWIFEFDSVKYNEDTLNDKMVKLDINLNIMIGTEEFRKKLKNTFFKESIENGICKENIFTSDKDGKTYIFYTFENNAQFKEIPNLFFFSKSLNETFKMSFSQFFIKNNQKYYFKIIFNKNPSNIWVFGQTFFNTYKLVFDFDEGKIGYYKTYSSNKGFIIIVCIIIFFVLIFGLGYLRGYMMTKNDPKIYNKNNMNYVIRKEYADSNNEEKNKEINKNDKNEKKDKPKKD